MPRNKPASLLARLAARRNAVLIRARPDRKLPEEHALSELIQHKVSGLRERNKLDKLRRIKDAASELFVRKGYDDTTTREIAVRAGVGLGTIFVYAATKRDLLFLIVNDDLQEVVEQAAATLRPDRPMLDNLLRTFQLHYRYFAQEPALSRLALREMSFYATGTEAKKFLKTRERLVALITEVVGIAIDRQAISSAESPEPDRAGHFLDLSDRGPPLALLGRA